MRSVIHPNEINEVMNTHVNSLEPVVGMTATMFVGSDRYAMVVTEVLGKGKVRVTHLDNEDYDNKLYVKEDGTQHLPLCNVVKYAYVPDDGGCVQPSGILYTYRKNGRWMRQGDDMWGTCSIRFGHANNYRDPSF